MDIPLKTALREKYPDLWPKDGGAARLSRFSPECEDGWYDIIDNALGEIDKACKLHDFSAEVQQIKEKFGGLRLYMSFTGANKDAYEICRNVVAKAEHDSHFTCEVCGMPAQLMCKQDRSWLKTICKKCIEFGASPHHVGYVEYQQPKEPLGE